MRAILIISHGSRSAKTKQELLALIEKIKPQAQADIFEAAFLEIETPSIPQGVDHCVEQGANEVIVTLNFLNSGRHVDEDIPNIINQAKLKYPQVKFVMTRPIGQHEQIAGLFLDLIQHA